MASNPGQSTPEWELGTTNFNVRAGVILGCYLLFTLYILVTMVMFYMQSRNPNSELSKRSVNLIMLQTIGCFIVGSLGAIGTALNTWACFPKLWMFNIGFIILISSLTGRGIQLIVVANVHSLNGQLQQCDKAIANSEDLVINGQPAWPAAYALNRVNDNLCKHRESTTSCDPRTQQPDCQIQERLQRYRRMSQYVTDRAMMLYIAIFTLIGIVITIVIQIVNDEYSIRPVSTECSFYWGLLPVFTIIVIFVVIIGPMLLLKIWKFKDAFGIRNDLIVCVTVGFVCIIVSLVWELEMHNIREVWSGLFFMWIATTLIHTSSVAVPLYRAMRHSRLLRYELFYGDNLGSTTAFFLSSKLTTDTNVPGKVRSAEFKQILDDPAAYSKFCEFTATCFSSELTGFIDRYRQLKDATIKALEMQDVMYPGIESSIGTLAPASQETEMFASAEHLPERLQLVREMNMKHSIAGSPLPDCSASITTSIMAAAQASHPHLDIDESAVFPSEMIDMLVSIFSVYINPCSSMALNISHAVMSRVQESLRQDNIPLTILDEIKEEVLLLLYTDIYTRYCRL